jgi:hypothetical protein
LIAFARLDFTKTKGDIMRWRAVLVLALFAPAAHGQPNPSALFRRAEADFNVRDLNGDGFLNRDEMPAPLKAELSKWDTNRDNLISLDEYKFYYAARTLDRQPRGKQQAEPIIVIEEEDLDARPVVLRAGKLPIKELPPWFMQLDTDHDGQVALSEWHKAGKDLDEFRDWDRNDDGFITPDEAVYKQRLIQSAAGGAPSAGGRQHAEYARPGAVAGPNIDLARDDRGRQSRKGDGFRKFKGPRQ